MLIVSPKEGRGIGTFSQFYLAHARREMTPRLYVIMGILADRESGRQGVGRQEESGHVTVQQ
jgi:hypothetical protein